MSTIEKSVYYVSDTYKKMAIIGSVSVNGLLVFSMTIPFLLWVKGGEILNLITAAALLVVVFYNVTSFFYWIKHTSLTISRLEIEYVTPGLKLKTSWRNIERIDKGYSRCQLILHKPSATYISPVRRFWKSTTSASKYIEQVIPINVFVDDTSQGDLLRKIEESLLSHTEYAEQR